MESAYSISASTVVCVRLFGPLEVARRGSDGSWQVVKKGEWSLGTPPRSVLKRLLTTPGRRLSRSDLEDDLWPETGMELAAQHLSNGLMVLRRILGKDTIETTGPLCALVDQARVWTDLDACYALLKEAENQGRTTPSALSLLENACAYFERGPCLEDEAEKWCHAVRADAERMQRQCRVWLAEGYEQAGKLWQAGEQYRAMTRAIPPDEEALQFWMQMLTRHGKNREATQCYQEVRSIWETQGFAASHDFEHQFHDLLSRQSFAPNRLHARPRHPLALSPWSGGDVLASLPVSPGEPLDQFLAFDNPLLIGEDTLHHFAALTDECRYLSEGNELRIAERVLWTYLPKIEQFTQIMSEYQQGAASIASQGYLLAASLVGHRNDLLARLRYSKQALHYGELAGDINLQIVSMRQIAISFDCMDCPEQVIEVSQRTFPRLSNASPLLQSCIYAGISGAYAEIGNAKETQHFMDLAYECFPARPEKEPGYLHTICRYSTLVFFDGLNALNLGAPSEAEAIFARIAGVQHVLPERVRIELLNYQIAAFIALNDMERACTYLEAATESARAIGSERHFREDFSLLHQMQKVWHNEPRVKGLTDLFVR